MFVTLTYSPEYLPYGASLVKKDLQNFFKRLRKELSKQKRKIKYYACGEYGDRFERPHYHAIIFGLDFLDRALIERIWPFGLVHLGYVSHASASYVAGYIDKKYVGEDAKFFYQDTGREPPFKTSSQGLGLRFAQDNEKRIKDNLYITYCGKKKPVPRYYRKKLEITADDFVGVVQESELKVLDLLFKDYSKLVDDFWLSLMKGELRLDDYFFRKILAVRNKQTEANIKARIAIKKAKNKNIL